MSRFRPTPVRMSIPIITHPILGRSKEIEGTFGASPSPLRSRWGPSGGNTGEGARQSTSGVGSDRAENTDLTT